MEERRRRERLRWDDCEKRDLAGVENESDVWGEWRMRSRDMGVENENERWEVENECKGWGGE